MRITPMLLSVSILSAVLLCGCSKEDAPKQASQSNPPATAEPQTAKAPDVKREASRPSGLDTSPAAGIQQPVHGTVLETMESGGYTYLQLETEQGTVWAATRPLKISVGDVVELAGIVPQANFHSRTLDRTFDQILFASLAVVAGQGATHSLPPQEPPSRPSGHPGRGAMGERGKAAAVSAPKAGDLEPASGGYTVEALYAKKGALAGKVVKLRGVVVKANRGIMGKNWLHLQDGTGQPGGNDVAVTSVRGYAKPGSVVVAEGRLSVDKNLGAGYVFAVLIEDAKITAEGGGADETPPAGPGEAKPAAPEPAPSESKDG